MPRQAALRDGAHSPGPLLHLWWVALSFLARICSGVTASQKSHQPPPPFCLLLPPNYGVGLRLGPGSPAHFCTGVRTSWDPQHLVSDSWRTKGASGFPSLHFPSWAQGCCLEQLVRAQEWKRHGLLSHLAGARHPQLQSWEVQAKEMSQGRWFPLPRGA